MAVSSEGVIDALRPVQDPELRRSIVELDMVRDVAVDGTTVALTVALTTPTSPFRNEIERRVTAAVAALDGVEQVALELTTMTDEERAALRRRLHGDPSSTAGSQPTHGHSEG
ncbi:MAG: iron-sulfur cluster assembly protein, partial [Actinobacteria bacterium]|nr:iron-sulfur cluster assembly protein [Actinomycetota bacterium]